MKAVGALTGLLLAAFGSSTALVTQVPEIIDGDTFILNGVIIRLFGIDAPEDEQHCTVDGTPWRCGQAAAMQLEMLLAGQAVTCITRDVDRYQREVATCSIDSGRLDVGSLMVGTGWALDYKKYSGGRYAKEEALAKERRSGIHAGEFELPWEWRKAHR